MLKKRFMPVTILLLTVTAYSYSAENPFPLPPSALSASYSDGSFSSIINPVFTDLDSAADLAYRYISYNGGEKGNHFGSFNLFGFDLIYRMYNTIPDTNGKSILNSRTDIFSINRGFFFGDIFGFGAGFSFGNSDDKNFDGYKAWNIGFLFRPVSFLSFGAVFRDLNGNIGGEKIDPAAIYSISVRPWKDYLTLSADCEKKENIKTKISYSGDLKGYKDISLNVKYGTDKSIAAGLTIPLYIRNGNGTQVIIDGYGSGRSKTADFKSAGIAFNLKRNSQSIQIAPSENYITLKINGNYAAERDFSGIFTRREATFQDLVRGIEKAGNDPTISGFIIEIDSAEFGMAQLEEIRTLLNRTRSNGKKVYSVLNNTGNREYFLAAVSDKIFLAPNNTFKISGLTVKAYFLKGLLDKGGVKFESFSKGNYKSYSEMFTRKDMSTYARENLTTLLADLNEQFISGITEGRKLSRSAIEELFKKGFYTPAEAKEKGFIDDVMYANEAVDSLQKKATTIQFTDYLNEEDAAAAWGTIPAIAVINVTGSIVSGSGGKSSISGSTGDDDYQRSIDAAFGDQSVKAVVIRIDSGGGSASASDFMWNALSSAKKKNPKPVVFSFGNTAASGGYYIACTGDPIFAGKGTVTGSIGVVAGKVSAEDLYAKIGISTETIKMSEFADIFSESRSLTENEKDLFQKEITFIYDRFTGKVLEGRNITGKEIPEIAEGRIHTGSAARGNKLVNETGGLIAAIEYARARGNLDSEFRIINLPENGSIFRGILGDSETLSIFKYMKFIVQNVEKYKMLEERTLYIQPYTIEIE